MRAEPYEVVIPTTGRETLEEAVASVAAQDHPPERVLVASRSATIDELGLHERLRPWRGLVQVVEIDDNAPAGAERHDATAIVAAPWVAFLDDDDVWDHRRASIQLEKASRASLVSCRYRLLAHGRCLADAVPARTIQRDDNLATYLFARRRLDNRRNSIQTSTLIVRSDLAKRVQWQLGLPRHQDWDFLLRCLEDETWCGIEQIDDVLVSVAYSSEGSISRSSDFDTSLTFYDRHGPQMDDRTAADFVMGQTVRYAAARREWREIWALLKLAYSRGRPSVRSHLLALSGLARVR
ncbi:MAG: glycosyltransferase family 2 protein [Actinomycetia bacterium]|nr:glycosyltransferase family 2 protein [Actinomycetes bacterium]MCP4959179.1 glycosyltransferase family 2 protein [Actinomycetes bacterium]